MAVQPIAALRDLFEDNVIASLWLNAFVPTGSASRSESSGDAVFTLPSSTAGSHQAGYQSSGTYDMTNAVLSINVDTMVSTAVAATAALTIFDSADPTSWVRIAQLSGNLNFQKSVAGVTTTIGTAVAWSAVTHKYWRIYETAGSIFVDTSSNGTSWTNRGSVTIAASFDPVSVLVRIDATCGNVASPGSFRVEELNAIYPALSSAWHWTQVEWPLQNRFLQITIASTSGQGYIATADSTDASGNLVSPRYYSGPLGSSSGGYNSLTLQASQALAQAQAVNLPLDGRWDLPSLDECRLIRLYHRSISGSYTLREYYPRRLVQSDDIQAESIRAINIAAGAITADKIFVLALSAITSSIGQLTLTNPTGAPAWLYQGTGTGDSPITGLKIFDSGGIGKLSGYNATVEQVTLDTDGKLKAGAGAVLLDANGVNVVLSGTFDAVRALRLLRADGTFLGGLGGAYTTGTGHGLELRATSIAGEGANVMIRAQAPSAEFAAVYLQVQSGLFNFPAVAASSDGTTHAVVIDAINTSGLISMTSPTTFDHNVGIGDAINSVTRLRVKGASSSSSDYALVVANDSGTALIIARNDNRIGVYGNTEVPRPTVTGSRGGNAALASLLTALQSIGWVVDSSS